MLVMRSWAGFVWASRRCCSGQECFERIEEPGERIGFAWWHVREQQAQSFTKQGTG